MSTQYINAPRNVNEPTIEQSQSSNQPEAPSTSTTSQPQEILTQSAFTIGSPQHKSLWEQGEIDYTGRDSFANIQAHLDAKIKGTK
jgi:hypothetical protein